MKRSKGGRSANGQGGGLFVQVQQSPTLYFRGGRSAVYVASPSYCDATTVIGPPRRVQRL